jgi:tetratricopeptide (TPR) repeat protein
MDRVMPPFPRESPEAAEKRWAILVSLALLAAAVLAAYSNSFRVPLLLDDLFTIKDNASIRHLWPLGPALFPPPSEMSAGRPLLNLTYALNFAAGGEKVIGYHVVNLLIHILSAWTLFGIVRRTLSRPNLRPRVDGAAGPLAFCVALLWALHPIQTASVTYIAQRAESLMGLFYLLSVYAFVRSADSARPGRWQLISVLACFAGALTKEVIATAPLLILLYDRTFIAGNFRGAFTARRRYYGGLFASWLLLGALMIGTHLGERLTGTTPNYRWWSYALTECQVIPRYLKLTLWPHPLIFDYGIDSFPLTAARIIPLGLVLLLALAATAFALRRQPALGFLGAWFFILLAPTSSVIPVSFQPMAENRLYLPIAAVATGFAVAVFSWAGRKSLLLLLALAIGLGALSWRRNRDFQSDLTIWQDTVAKEPRNTRALTNLADSYSQRGRFVEAIASGRAALEIRPDNVAAHVNLANALLNTPGGAAEAITHYEAAIHAKPDFPDAYSNLGNALLMTPGRLDDAIASYEKALQLRPDYADAHNNLANALLRIPGRLPDAIAHFEEAIRLRPGFVEAIYNLAIACEQLPGGTARAIRAYELALTYKPDFALAHNNLGNALLNSGGSVDEAIRHLETARRLRPDDAGIYFNLGLAVAKIPARRGEAVALFHQALQLRPDLEPARRALENLGGVPAGPH